MKAGTVAEWSRASVQNQCCHKLIYFIWSRADFLVLAYGLPGIVLVDHRPIFYFSTTAQVQPNLAKRANEKKLKITPNNV